MTAALRLGGPLAVRCPTCLVAAGASCTTLAGPSGRPTPWPRTRMHAARRKAGPPEQEVRVGDLVIVRYGFGEVLALFLGAPFTARVRLWDGRLGQWGREVDRMLADVLRLAPDDATTAAARAALAGAP